MSFSSLDNLRYEFAQANLKHSYLGRAKDDPKKLEHTTQKNLRLAQVFKLAREEIEENLKEDNTQAKDIGYLRSLEQEGKIIYERYEKSTHSWKRWFLKCLTFCVPDLLKIILPCFSNDMEKAEQETLEEYEKFKRSLAAKLSQAPKAILNDDPLAMQGEDEEDIFDPDQDEVSKEKAFNPVDDFLNEDIETQKLLMQLYSKNSDLSQDPTETPLTDPSLAPVIPQPLVIAAPSRSKEEIEQAMNQDLDLISKFKHLVNQFQQRPLSMQKMTNILEEFIGAVNHLIKLDSELQNPVETDKPLFPGIKSLSLSTLLEKLINAQTFQALTDPNLKVALDSKDNQKVLDLLQATPWHASFQEAFAQKGHIAFGIRKLPGQIALMLANEEGSRITEGTLKNYRGEVQLNSIDVNDLNVIEEFQKFLTQHTSFAPSSLVISMKEDQRLTPKFLELLMQLKDRVGEIRINGLQEINFKELALSEAEEYLFIQHLDSFVFPDVDQIVLSDHSKKNWTAQDFSRLLALCPCLPLLKECYQHCSSYQQIVIPSELANIQELDAQGFALDHMPHLLSQFSQATSINLSGLSMTDAQLLSWITQGKLNQVKNLQLKDCQALTTDILPALAKLPQLAMLALPDLPKGNISLDHLPKFENPFKIKMLYTASKTTQSLAARLYTGPQIWAPVFQIPLARLGVAEIFTNQRRLDPKAVAYWLHNRDDQHLTPQEGVTTIIADSNEALNDDNLVEFMLKFPKAKSLSLYNCPHVTDTGIIKLLQAHSSLETLDLTGCPHITESLLLGDGNFDVLKKLNQLIVTDTGIPRDVVTIFQEEKKPKLAFEETTLKITNDDLTEDDDDAFEKFLNAQPLNKLKRVDLENCTKLTNQMLGQLLDALNADELIKTPEGTFVDNPQRLNAAVINLKGCTKISAEAFDHTVEPIEEGEVSKGKIEPKHLESLDRVIIEGKETCKLLTGVYPRVTFQEFDEPITLQANPERQLQECIDYHHKKKNQNLDEEETRELKRLSAGYVHHRMAVELFCEGKEQAKEVFEEAVDTASEEFCDITLAFKTNDQADPVKFSAHRDVLYMQSLYFINGFRAGGKISKNVELTFINQHATSKAVQAVMDLFYGKLNINALDWQTAADVAELIGKQIFKLPTFNYDALLNQIYQKFNLTEAENIMMAVKLLEAKMDPFEQKLLQYLDRTSQMSSADFQKIANIAKEYELKKLKERVAKIEEAKSQELIKQNLAAQARDDERLLQGMLLSQHFTDYV